MAIKVKALDGEIFKLPRMGARKVEALEDKIGIRFLSDPEKGLEALAQDVMMKPMMIFKYLEGLLEDQIDGQDITELVGIEEATNAVLEFVGFFYHPSLRAKLMEIPKMAMEAMEAEVSDSADAQKTR